MLRWQSSDRAAAGIESLIVAWIFPVTVSQSAAKIGPDKQHNRFLRVVVAVSVCVSAPEEEGNGLTGSLPNSTRQFARISYGVVSIVSSWGLRVLCYSFHHKQMALQRWVLNMDIDDKVRDFTCIFATVTY